ncbi:PIN domain-containing protein [Kitasatospora sp. YST-16]|uniref:PIN domain-containing protein n=1 Tax=unclassified Kitasatospora TaxID=2633591 RepID=UPI0004C38499|nr:MULTISPECIES: PIN domain-containing protein [unclassified Kitasatospora]WAL72704.1 PIN domain-containing protein [Kitasatospora sp. YST-16]WNW38753.1 PIN domain-containing protein [Streptomyces sp. Li-HN-5-13]
MAFIVLYDSNVLYPNTVRDLLVRLARHGIVQAKWTEQILDEVEAALRRNGVGNDGKRAELRRRMNAAVRDCLVTGYEPLIEGLKLPDPDDRHVLAAAIKAGAQVIVTDNAKHFPVECTAEWGIEQKSADDFVMDLIDLDDRVVYGCVMEIVGSRRREPVTFDDVLNQLERSRLIGSVSMLRGRPVEST